MDKITKAITLRTTDINDNDKLLTIYSLDSGLLSVKARGVRKSTAKLKFVREPFCFGDFELIGKGDRYVLKTCTQIESFSAITSDIISYYCGCVAVDMVAHYEHEGANADIFLALVRAISLFSSHTNSLVVLIRYILYYFSCTGYSLSFDNCNSCGSDSNLVLDYKQGGVVCGSCSSGYSLPISREVLAVLRTIANASSTEVVGLSVSDQSCRHTLELLARYMGNMFSPIRSLTALIDMI